MPRVTTDKLKVKDWIDAELTRRTIDRVVNLGWGGVIVWGLYALPAIIEAMH